MQSWKPNILWHLLATHVQATYTFTLFHFFPLHYRSWICSKFIDTPIKSSFIIFTIGAPLNLIARQFGYFLPFSRSHAPLIPWLFDELFESNGIGVGSRLLKVNIARNGHPTGQWYATHDNEHIILKNIIISHEEKIHTGSANVNISIYYLWAIIELALPLSNFSWGIQIIHIFWK